MFFQTDTPPVNHYFAVPMFIFWITISLFVILLIRIKKLSRNVRITILVVATVFAGVIFGGFPNLLMPFQQTLSTIAVRGDVTKLFPVFTVFGGLIITTIFLGRVLCGFACHIGTLQELISQINFKSDEEAQNNNKFHIETSSVKASLIRRFFLFIIILLAGIWSIQILQIFNPNLGFWYFINMFTFTFIFPLIGLVVVSIISIFIYRPFCRFICPAGAVASLCARVTRRKYRRTKDCNECGLCEKICPTQEASADSKKNECYYCNRCIEVCPKDAIEFSKS